MNSRTRKRPPTTGKGHRRYHGRVKRPATAARTATRTNGPRVSASWRLAASRDGDSKALVAANHPGALGFDEGESIPEF
jgi:hypothetical protein